MEKIIQKKLFNKEECDYFKSLYKNKIFKQSELDRYGILSKYRNSSELTLQLNTDLSTILLNRLKEFEIKSLPKNFKILKYDKNQEFKIHTDTSNRYPSRYKTLIIQLSNETDYSEGDFSIFYDNKIIICSKEIGNTIMFDSTIYHSANKIIDGTRYSMVFWLSTDNFKLKNSLI